MVGGNQRIERSAGLMGRLGRESEISFCLPEGKIIDMRGVLEDLRNEDGIDRPGFYANIEGRKIHLPLNNSKYTGWGKITVRVSSGSYIESQLKSMGLLE